MNARFTAALLVASALAAPSAPGEAQEAPALIEVGATAPDVSFTGADRYGVLRDPVHLSDFRGETVVLAFFFRARTPG